MLTGVIQSSITSILALIDLGKIIKYQLQVLVYNTFHTL